jgi:hypothetical protein
VNRLLRVGLKVTGVGVLSVVGMLLSGPWGPCGPSSATGLIFMLTALFCLPIGALVLIAGLVVFAFERRAVAQADLQSR